MEFKCKKKLLEMTPLLNFPFIYFEEEKHYIFHVTSLISWDHGITTDRSLWMPSLCLLRLADSSLLLYSKRRQQT